MTVVGQVISQQFLGFQRRDQGKAAVITPCAACEDGMPGRALGPLLGRAKECLNLGLEKMGYSVPED